VLVGECPPELAVREWGGGGVLPALVACTTWEGVGGVLASGQETHRHLGAGLVLSPEFGGLGAALASQAGEASALNPEKKSSVKHTATLRAAQDALPALGVHEVARNPVGV